MARFTVTGRPLFEIQVEAADKAEAAKRWHEALQALSSPPDAPYSILSWAPDVEGVEMAFFSDEGENGELVSDLYVDEVDL